MDEPVSWQSPTLGPMAWVPPGRFLMGSPPEEVGRAVDEPQHWAEIGAGFWMMVHPVTQGQWAAVMGHNPSRFAGEGRELHPVEQVSWLDAQAFIARVGAIDGVTYRLPTEAEWEYAARGGEAHLYAGGAKLSAVGWYRRNSGGSTRPVCQKAPNGYRLHDMTGNVWEWVEDLYGPYPQDGATQRSETYRVFRGGGWYDNAERSRIAMRLRLSPERRCDDVGFRLVRA